MLNRREFITTAAGGFATLLLTPIIGACGSDSTSPSTSTTTNPTEPSCDGAGETSSVTLGHTHSLCVPLSDLDNPPAAGATYLTTTTDGHQHQVTLTQAQLMMVAQGQTVNVTTSTASAPGFTGHTHAFAVQKAAAPAPPPPPVTSPY